MSGGTTNAGLQMRKTLDKPRNNNMAVTETTTGELTVIKDASPDDCEYIIAHGSNIKKMPPSWWITKGFEILLLVGIFITVIIIAIRQ